MRPLTKRVVTRIYRIGTTPPGSEELVEVEPGLKVPRYSLGDPEVAEEESRRFFGRMPTPLDLTGKSVLDVGCGRGELCVEAARRGAGRAVGVDLGEEGIRAASARIAKEDPDLPVELRSYDGDLKELGHERFDLVLSKDSFEHYGAAPGTPDAEEMVRDMAGLLAEGGLLAIGFGPLWKAPLGGHIDVRLPWWHLIFPEEVIFDEFRRVRPPGKTARTFEEGVGVNRMTLDRFLGIMDRSGLERVALATNVSDHPAVRAMRGLARVPGVREYMTTNAYGIWRRASRSRRAASESTGV